VKDFICGESYGVELPRPPSVILSAAKDLVVGIYRRQDPSLRSG